ncbi:MAG: LptE family protein, partial [Deltaproteobacteria bacterium]|nr:LptE family protein [Deltaproteobacteria bacterium]
LCSGCGYRLATPDGPLLDTVSTIAVPYFKNKTFEPGAEALFTAAFVNEFIESRRIGVVSAQEADAVLRGTIVKLVDDAIAYNSDDKAQHYRVHVILDVTVEDRRSGKMLWQRKGLQHSEEFPVSGNIVFSEAAKREALKTLADDLAERVHDSIMHGF